MCVTVVCVVAESSPRRRTGGRSAMVLASIRKAVEGLIAEQGSDAVTIPWSRSVRE